MDKSSSTSSTSVPDLAPLDAPAHVPHGTGGQADRARDAHPPRDTHPRDSAPPSVSVSVTLMLFVAALLLIRFVVPRIVEEVQYGLVRGRQRAEHDVADRQLAKAPLAELSQASQLVSKRIAPSVVHIDTRRSKTDPAPQDEFSHLFGTPQLQNVLGQGSGVIIDASGDILTNHHVIRGAEEIVVTLSDDRRKRAKVIGVDPVTDLAVLKVQADRLNAATWGDSESLREGALVWAAGSPFGLNKTITFGIVSARDRRGFDGEKFQDFLQSDAAVSPGNSGGPLVDIRGHVVGINTAIVGPTYQGVSFAIPSRVAREVYEKLRTQGNLPRGWLGVRLEAVSHQRAQQAGMAAPLGAVVTYSYPESPARLAGVQTGDIITHWNRRPVDSPTMLTRLVAKTEIGTAVRMVVRRSGRQRTLHVKVGERPLQFYR